MLTGIEIKNINHLGIIAGIIDGNCSGGSV
jgi:hypothetical protein